MSGISTRGFFYSNVDLRDGLFHAAPLMRAGEVEDAHLKGLYALQASQTAGQLIREEKDAGYVVESLRHNASESANMWEKARDWDAADRIENSRLGKKNSLNRRKL